MLLLSRTYSFEAAHELPDWPDVHGHSYEVQVWLKGEGDYVLPVDEFDAAMAPILKKVDHKMLNDVIDVPTMENIAKWFWNELTNLPVHKVSVHRPTLKMTCEYSKE